MYLLPLAYSPRNPLTVLVALMGAVFLMGTVLDAQAQINTERMRSMDADGTHTTIGGNVALMSGNNNVLDVGLSARFDWRTGPHYSFVVAQSNFAERRRDGESIRFRDQSFTHVRYNYDFTPRVTGEGFTQVERNDFTLLQFRLLVGSGPRIAWLDTDRVFLYQGTALMFEQEDRDERRVVNYPSHQALVRWTNYVNVRVQIADGTSIQNTVYAQPRVTDFGDVRLLNEAVLAVRITPYVTLRTTLNLNYNRQPPDNIDPLDVTLRNGIQVTF